MYRNSVKYISRLHSKTNFRFVKQTIEESMRRAYEFYDESICFLIRYDFCEVKYDFMVDTA